ncbi:polysaccharide deacetylase family protein [Lacticaseibacillus parakribbianus]|uniref:polysaccharide deacetylase family protein n=1 Tax=Lacticaseibacillus parakribbianus TaxID=2970927 RepID=UPI0021CB4A99|nr:polysaccharide deacetylase family protein [Lacticaseibacillus parakribbianus]
MSRRWVKWVALVAALAVGVGLWGWRHALEAAPKSPASRAAASGRTKHRPAKSEASPSGDKGQADAEPGKASAAAKAATPKAAGKSAAAKAAKASGTSRSEQAAATKEAATPALPKGQNHVAAADAYATPAQKVHDDLFAPLDAKRPKVVYLTFDDGPNLTMTPRVLKVLEKAKVHATFFVVGSQVSSTTAPVLRQAVAQGNAIGLHSFSHTYGFEECGSAAETTSEVTRTLAAVRRVLGAGFATGAWRYPGGHMSWHTLAAPDAVLKRAGLAWIDWNDAVGDALGASGPHSVAGYLAYHQHALDAYGQHNTTVVLMHDAAGKELTLATLPKLIEWYKTHGYHFGVIS